ncbi:hypothetical protein BCR34DRAFT_617456 [Clohesyomyces aquaticus]|uniref:Uncharacterized protein n=1 Tax=Clohesyomyces aquaticus TaxID=1231657 RepID=A0A1Y1Z2N3_9PLEO|nr:hypothetical protein BCR34DRAFT_617456 [Clohesyomyces aquaticus]
MSSLQSIMSQALATASSAPRPDEAEALKYWGVLGEETELLRYDGLGLAFYDYLRATSHYGPTSLQTAGAKSYVTPEMMFQFRALLGIDIAFSAKEIEYLDIATMDEFLYQEYGTLKLAFQNGWRRSDVKTPYLTRVGFITYFSTQFMGQPVNTPLFSTESTRSVVFINNADRILKGPNHLILDPWTDDRFRHAIPRHSIDRTVSSQVADALPKLEPMFAKARAETLVKRRTEAISKGERPTPGLRGGMTGWEALQVLRNAEDGEVLREVSMRSQGPYDSFSVVERAAQNRARMNLAQTQLYNQVLLARATEQGFAAMNSAIF